MDLGWYVDDLEIWPEPINCDLDGDGYESMYCEGGDDCDDYHSSVCPDPLLCPEKYDVDNTCFDGLDNDCDGLADEVDPDCNSDCIDLDGDGYGNPGNPNCLYSDEDCDDNAPDIYPGADDSCDGVDQSCDGSDGISEILGNGIDDDCDGKIDEACFIQSVLRNR